MVTAMKAHLEDLKFPAARTVSKAEDPVSFCSLSTVSSVGPYEFFPCRSSSSSPCFSEECRSASAIVADVLAVTHASGVYVLGALTSCLLSLSR